MAKTKSITPIELEIGVKNRKPYQITVDAWNFGGYGNQHAIFTLRGELVLAVAYQKWDYIRRVTPLEEVARG